MNKTLIVLFSGIWISTRICETWGYGNAIPSKIEGDDLCRLGIFLTTEEKVAVSEIQVEGIQHVPISTPEGNHLSSNPRAFVVAMERILVGSGAHRQLETNITLELEASTSLELPEECDLVILEKLSNCVFSDPFQLQRLKEQGACRKVHIYGDVDLERPGRTSYQSIVEIHIGLVEKEVAAVGVVSKQLQAKVSLPLHARYPPTGVDTYFQLNITMPQVMVKCKSREDSSTYHGQETCIQAFTYVPPQTLHWFLPTGSPRHSLLVDGATTGAALIGVVSVFLASKKSSLMNKPERP